VTPFDLSVTAIGGLVGLAVAADRVYVSDRRARVARARAAVVAASYGRRPLSPSDASPRALVRQRSLARVHGAILHLFRIQPAERNLYPAPWWALLLIVIGSTLIASVVAARFVGVIVWLAFPVFAVILSRNVFGLYQRRHQKRLYEQIPDTLSMIIRAVRAGLPVVEALRSVGNDAPLPTAQEFRLLNNDLAVGTPLDDALISLSLRTGMQEYRFFAVTLGLQAQTGGNLAETLENLADVVRKRVALRARALALAAEARMTANVLIALPFVTCIALALVAPDYLTVLFAKPQGRMMLLVAVGLLMSGVVAMRTIIHRSLS
jgi:tight adherence protein B